MEDFHISFIDFPTQSYTFIGNVHQSPIARPISNPPCVFIAVSWVSLVSSSAGFSMPHLSHGSAILAGSNKTQVGWLEMGQAWSSMVNLTNSGWRSLEYHVHMYLYVYIYIYIYRHVMIHLYRLCADEYTYSNIVMHSIFMYTLCSTDICII